MPTFTVEREFAALYRTTVTVEATDLFTACRKAFDADTDAWKLVDDQSPTYVVAIAQGDDVNPWTTDASGADTSVLIVPPIFSDIAQIMGYPAARADDLVLQLRIMCDAIGADGTPRIDAAAMGRLCATGRALLGDIDRCGLPSEPGAPHDPVPSVDAPHREHSCRPNRCLGSQGSMHPDQRAMQLLRRSPAT